MPGQGAFASQPAEGSQLPRRRRRPSGRRPPSSRARRPAPPACRPASWRRSGLERQPAVEAVGELGDGVRAPPGSSAGGASSRLDRRRRAAAATSLIPEWSAATGGTPQAADSAGHHSERLGPGARHGEGLGGRHHVGDLVVLEATADQDRTGGVAGGVGVALRRVRQEGGEDRKRLVLIPLETASPAATPRAASRSPAPRASTSVRSPSSKAPKPMKRSRGPGAPAARRARWTSGQAAASRSTPLLTRSLPTKSTRGSPSARGHACAARRRDRRARTSRRPLPRDVELGRRGARRAERGRGWPPPRDAAGSGARRRPGGPSRVRSRRPGSGTVSKSASRRVGGADQDPGCGIGALARVGDEAVGVRAHRVGDVRAVHLDREAQPGPRQDHRAHDQVVGERGVRIARGRDHVATAATFASR